MLIEVSLDEMAFRMSEIAERWQSLMEAALASACRLLGQLRESAAFSAHLELLLALRRRIELHPLAPQLSHIYHARMVPMIDELGHNGILAVAGAALVGGFVRWRESAAGVCLDVVKPQKMAGIVREATTCDGDSGNSPLSGMSLRYDLEAPRIVTTRQVLIRVTSVAVDDADLRGLKSSARSPGVFGLDLVGTVCEVGKEVEHVDVGDRVWSVAEEGEGTMRQFVVTEASRVFRRPQTLSDEGAATLPFSFLCALSALSDGCGITPANAATKSVFVSDGTSPTGCVVLQLLKSWGAFRVVTCSPYRAVRLARLLCGGGGSVVIPAMPDHRDTEDTCRAELDASEAFDAAVVTSDILSVEFCSKYSDAVASAVCGDDDGVGKRPSKSWLPWKWRGGRRRRRSPTAAALSNLDKLHLLSTLVEDGQLQPVLDVSYPIERFDEAFERTANTEQKVGKIVIRLV